MGAREDLLAVPDEMLRDGRIGQELLVFMDFLGEPRRWWTGFGALDVGGHRWLGVGDLIDISPIETTYSVSAEQVTFQMAATAELVALSLASRTRVRDRTVRVYLQYFLLGDDFLYGQDQVLVQSGQPLASPLSLFSGTMQGMPWEKSGPNSRSISLECEGLFFRRNSAPRGRWTDPDQKGRYVGDRGFERLPIYAGGYETKWRG